MKHRYAAEGGGVDIEEYAYTLGPAGNRTKVEEYRYTEGTQPGAPDRTVDYKYDDLYRLTKEIVTTAADGWRRTDTYTYDKVGNRLNLLRQTPEAQTAISYQYNNADQLLIETQTTLPADGGTYSAKPRPGKSAGITLAVLATATLTFALTPFVLLRTNARGRRARRNRRFIAAISAFFVPLMAVDPTTVYALQNESLAYQALVTAGVANIDPNTTVTEYNYDSKGNTVAKLVNSGGVETSTEYTYDAENRLITVDQGNGAINLTTYTYDDEGIRTSKRVGNNLTTYITDKNRPYAQVLEEINETGEVIKRYVYGHDLISQANNPGQPEETRRYFHYDGQMSTRTLSEGATDATLPGCKIGEITYDAFGNIESQQGLVNTDYLYAGEQYDANAGFYYLRARYYNQTVGRFISRDSYGGQTYDPISLHRYLYANSNPIENCDPTGNFTIVGLVATVGISALLISFAFSPVRTAKFVVNAAVTLYEFMRNVFKLDTWLVAIGAILADVIDTLTDAGRLIKWLLWRVVENLFPIVALLRVGWDLFKNSGFIKDVCSSGLTPSQVGRGMASLTASVAIGSLVGKVKVSTGIYNRGGSFGALKLNKLTGEVGNHMPQNAFIEKVLGLHRNDGPALGMAIGDHELTRTMRIKGAWTMRDEVGMSARSRLAADIKDIRSLFGRKYNDGLREMLSYAKTLPEFKK